VGASCSTVAVPKSQSPASISAIKTAADSVRAACLAGNGAVPTGYYVVGDGPVIGPKQ
jgi:hypothetical protein